MNKKILLSVLILFTLIFVSACDEDYVARKISFAGDSDSQSFNLGGNELIEERPEEPDEISIEEIRVRAPPRRDDGEIDCGTIIDEEWLRENEIERNEESGRYEIIINEDINCDNEEFRERSIPAITLNHDDIKITCREDVRIISPGENMIQGSYGVYFSEINGGGIFNCDLSRFSSGIYLSNSNENEIRGNIINENSIGSGITLYDSNENNITNNTANGNEWYGINLHSSSSNIITNNIANNNKREGIYIIGREVGRGSILNTITNNIANNNLRFGIYIWISNENNITNNTANGNEFYGIYLFNSNENEIIKNTANRNRVGIFLRLSADNDFSSNHMCFNRRDIFCSVPGRNTFENNRYNTLTRDQCDIEIEEGIPCPHIINLKQGWNIISSYVTPEDLNTENIFSDITNLIVMVKDDGGRFYRPQLNFNNMEEWDPTRGYKIQVSEDTEFIIVGNEYTPKTINLRSGWNMIAWPLNRTIEGSRVIEEVFEPIIEEDMYILIKSSKGGFYHSGYNFNNIKNFESSKGYEVFLSGEEVELDFSVLE